MISTREIVLVRYQIISFYAHVEQDNGNYYVQTFSSLETKI